MAASEFKNDTRGVTIGHTCRQNIGHEHEDQ